MLHITDITSIMPAFKDSEDYHVICSFSNGETKKIVFEAPALNTLFAHFESLSEPPSEEEYPNASP